MAWRGSARQATNPPHPPTGMRGIQDMKQALTIPKFLRQHANAELRKKDGPWFWVRIPTAMDSLSRQRLVQTAEGRQAYCVYVHLVSVAAKDPPRGVLADERGPFTYEDLALKTALPEKVIRDAVVMLSDPSVAWVEAVGDWESNGVEIPDQAVHSNSDSGSISASPAKRKTAEHFDAFWRVYPKKAGKPNARKKWKDQQLDDIADQVMAGLERCKGSKQWQREGGQYIPHPTTWLNREGWHDELDGTTTQKATKAAWDAITAETKAELLKAVQDADPSVDHRVGNVDTQRAMRKLAKERGLI